MRGSCALCNKPGCRNATHLVRLRGGRQVVQLVLQLGVQLLLLRRLGGLGSGSRCGDGRGRSLAGAGRSTACSRGWRPGQLVHQAGVAAVGLHTGLRATDDSHVGA